MKLRGKHRAVVAVLAAGAIAFGAAACGDDDDSGAASDTAAGGGTGGKIAFLLPETQNARYEAKDRPLFTAKVKELCPDCEVLYSNAGQNAAKQQQQAEAALTNGAQVLVLDAVDAASTGPIVAQANAKNVPVFAYDRAIPGEGVAYHNSYDNAKVGELQATSLLDKLTADGKQDGTIVQINGAPTDNNATLFKKGAHSVLDGKVNIGKEYDTKEWKPENANTNMAGALSALGKDKVVGVYSANDGMAGGIITALKAAGLSPLPPVTGQDAELAGVQRIVAGEQFMSVYKPYAPEGAAAAEMAVALAKGEKLDSIATSTVDSPTQKAVPTVLVPVVSLTKDNIKDTVVKDGVYTVEEICADKYAAACATLGLK